jgi:hypothetical protein
MCWLATCWLRSMRSIACISTCTSPRLQHGAGIAAFFAARGLDLVRFASGQRKDLVTAGYLQRAELDDRGLVPAQVLDVGVAQEKQKVFRTSKRRNPVTGPPTRGWSPARGWSISITSIASMRTSGPCA